MPPLVRDTFARRCLVFLRADKIGRLVTPWGRTGGGKTVATTLVESLAGGDPEAFAALYDRLAGRLLAAARTMIGSAADAEDVV